MRSWIAGALPGSNYFVAEEPAAYVRARPTVYLDTSIPSYLTARMSSDLAIARRQRITRVWWERYRPRYTLCVSGRVLTEAGAGDLVAAQERLRALDVASVLGPNEKSRLLAARLNADGLLPVKAWADAEHIAIAAAHSMAVLLTWNCRHLANPSVLRKVVRTCEEHDLVCPDICTPEKLMRTYAHERRPVA